MHPYTIICFPFAGGSRYSFLNFKECFKPEFELQLLESPGHGNRFNEPLLYAMEEIVQDLSRQVLELRTSRFCFWGHSMGAVTAYLVTQLLRNNGGPLPSVLFASGSSGIPLEKKEDGVHTMSATRFWEAVIALGGISAELIEDDNMRRLIEPVLRADLMAMENFHLPQPVKLPVPVLTINGDEDNRSAATVHYRAFTPWDQLSPSHTTGTLLKGNHFFIYRNMPELKQVFMRSLFNYSDAQP